jgi:hypothetical protein
VYVPAGLGDAVTVADPPAQIDALLTVTVGGVVSVTVPEAGKLVHAGIPVDVMVTLYVPATVVVNDATLPGGVAAAGTVQA